MTPSPSKGEGERVTTPKNKKKGVAVEKELWDRLAKVTREQEATFLTSARLLELTIATLEAVKAYKIASGFYSNSDIQAFDQVSGVLRTCR